MTRDQIKTIVLRLLASIAPEADLERLNPTASFRDQVDIDSVDFLNFVVAVHKELGVEIPEKDYPKLATLNSCLDYLASCCR
jgi:acyl carrier protein